MIGVRCAIVPERKLQDEVYIYIYIHEPVYGWPRASSGERHLGQFLGARLWYLGVISPAPARLDIQRMTAQLNMLEILGY